jgi:hypothetical protein
MEFYSLTRLHGSPTTLAIFHLGNVNVNNFTIELRIRTLSQTET